MARWLSPDPSALAAVNPANPQTWNEYAYVANQPLTATDPEGLMCAAGQCTDGSPQFVLGLGFMASGGPSGQWPNSLTSIQFLDELPGGGAFLSMGEVGGPVAPPATAGYNPGGGGSTVGSSSQGMGVGPGPAQGPITWVPFGAQAWIGVPVPGGPSQDVALNSNAAYTLGLVGQETAFLTHPEFYAEWVLSAAATSLGLTELGSAWDAATAGLSNLGNLRTALVFAAMTSPAVQEFGQAAQDFEAGWNGWPSAVNPNWINAAGAEAHRIVQCPPWDAWAGSCG